MTAIIWVNAGNNELISPRKAHNECKNKANLRDLIVATSLIILLKSDPNNNFIIMGRMGICFTSVVTSWWGKACCLLSCFLTGTLYCIALSAVLNFDYLGECSHWGNLGRVAEPTSDENRIPLNNTRNFISQRSTSHATQSFITPGEPQFLQLFCPCMVQLLAEIISLRRVRGPNPVARTAALTR